ncbi:MAG: circularly permuted type 2 ATP-grasp protein, partial [Rhodospirillaceae bacterium]
MFPQMGGGLGESSGTDPSQGLLPGIPDPQYPVAEGFFDEMMASQDQMRPHWVALMDRITALGPSDMAQRWERAERLIRDNGVTYNLYGDPEGFGRPWSLDPLPMIVSSEEWADIEAALIQRAQLLNSIIADLYGKRSLINESHLPASLLYANPGFLWPLDGAKPKDGVYLHFYAADLARSQDGRWWVVSDRTDAPAGVGYALENRIITSRILSDIYRESQVRRLAPFFMKVRETLSHLSPRGTENPRVVLWTPGPYNETHYEHVYLARYLGLTLVEGQDMTCRDGRVYLKTLDGLKQIDVILRRNEGSWCDPLELRGESHLGVPGLVEAVQSGNVTMANALGSRVVEAPGLNPFLESLCRRLLGEDLRMPSVATWWCGQPQERDHVLANLQNLIVRPSFNAHAGMISGGDLDIRYREALAEQIRQEPWNYIGQENFHLSSVPVWSRHGINPRQMVMRIQLVAHDGSYVAM